MWLKASMAFRFRVRAESVTFLGQIGSTDMWPEPWQRKQRRCVASFARPASSSRGGLSSGSYHVPTQPGGLVAVGVREEEVGAFVSVRGFAREVPWRKELGLEVEELAEDWFLVGLVRGYAWSIPYSASSTARRSFSRSKTLS